MAEEQTFAEAAGTPANVKAKELAKKSSAEKKSGEPSISFYTLKGLNKVVKKIVKDRCVIEVYVGNMKRHKDGLLPLIAKWKENGEWVDAHAVPQKIEALRAELAKKPRRK